MTQRVVLAYSGGLDTSVAIGWIQAQSDAEVIACIVDVGQGGEDLEVVRRRALACGAADAVVVDAKEEFARDFVAPALHANALYQGRYPLVSALSRPLITKHLVETAQRFGATAIAHGCTGKGNDQVRFEVSAAAIAPELRVLAPVRDSGMTRDKAIGFAEERGLPIDVSKHSPYSVDQNLWGRTAECGVLEDPWETPPEEVYAYTADPTVARPPGELTVTFVAGVPTAIDGREQPLAELIAAVQQRAGAHGIGRIDLVEDRLVGIKSREIYECPAAITLLTAHKDLEDLTLERELARYKRDVERRWAELVYDGLWFSPLKRALDAFLSSAAARVSGDVRLR
ncbi:MAG: argininosuccinate synthase, partial [Mycobacteriales bacterium]